MKVRIVSYSAYYAETRTILEATYEEVLGVFVVDSSVAVRTRGAIDLFKQERILADKETDAENWEGPEQFCTDEEFLDYYDGEGFQAVEYLVDQTPPAPVYIDITKEHVT